MAQRDEAGYGYRVRQSAKEGARAALPASAVAGGFVSTALATVSPSGSVAAGAAITALGTAFGAARAALREPRHSLQEIREAMVHVAKHLDTPGNVWPFREIATPRQIRLTMNKVNRESRKQHAGRLHRNRYSTWAEGKKTQPERGPASR